MYLKNLDLLHFRNLVEQKIEFEKNLNIIHGDNAQGKTSILEAIHFLSITRSFRSNSEKIVLQNSKENFDIKGYYINSEEQLASIRLFYSIKDGKHIFFNDNKIKKFSELIGIVPVVLLSLEDLELTYGYPSNRRKFVDILLSQVSPLYLNALQHFKQSLMHRNKLLNLIFEKKEEKKSLYPWNEQLIQYGSEIIKYRNEFIFFLNKKLSYYYQLISNQTVGVNARYKSGVSNKLDYTNMHKIKDIFAQRLEDEYANDLVRQNTSIGPHRDDIEFYLDNRHIKMYGSQGENKTFLIALKFIEGEYLRDRLKNNPIFLMDDIFGELDNNRIEHLIRQVSAMGQTFITTTLMSKFLNKKQNSINYLRVVEGRVSQ